MITDLAPDQPLYIIGTGGLAKELAHWIVQSGKNNIAFVDPTLYQTLPKASACVLGFAIPQYRTQFFNENKIDHMIWPYFVHPTCFLGGSNKIGKGTVLYPNIYCGYEVALGDFVFAHQCVSIGHRTVVGDYSLLHPNVTIGGGTTIGSEVVINMSCVIKDLIDIVDRVDLLMTSVVTKSIPESGKYFGNRRLADADS